MAFRTNKTPVLQEKSASGSVASFNTALAMPLASCTSLITGYQEGSGIPSPQNERPLHAWSSAILTATGENIADIADKATSTTAGIESTITDSKLVATGTSMGNGDIKVDFNNALVIKSGMSLTFTLDGTDIRSASLYVFLHKKDGSYTAPQPMVDTSHSLTLTKEGVYDYMLLRTTLNQTVDIDAYIMISTTNQSYIPYNGNTYTFTFGQSIYQGSIDWLRGVVVGTHKIKSIDSSSQIDHGEGTNVFYINDFFDIADDTETTDCNYFVRSEQNYYTIANVQTYMEDKAFTCAVSINRLFIKNTDWSSLSDFLTWLGSGHIDIAIKLATPIEIPLGGINLLTQEGQNNIFADCGDIDLTYKDLDIAKRGNFREVFRLPS